MQSFKQRLQRAVYLSPAFEYQPYNTADTLRTAKKPCVWATVGKRG